MSDDAARPPVVLDVTGGAAGVAASYAEARSLADAFDTAADRMRGWGADGLRVMKDPDLLESGLLSPATCAVAEAAVLAATGGRDGILAASLGWEADAVGVRCAVGLLEATDDAVHDAFEVVDYAVVRAAATGLLVSPLLATTAAAVVSADPGAAEDALTDHPGLVQHAVNGGGGLLDALAAVAGVPLLTPTTEDGAGLLAGLYGDDGEPTVTPYDDPAGVQSRPGSVRDLLVHLAGVAALSDGEDSPANGTIEVQTITRPGGQVSHIVYLPGTDDFNAPWAQDGDVRDLHTNLDLVAGQDDAYQQGVLQALHDAGVRPDEPVLLVGHSQGGMEAVAILSGESGFHVTDAVTAGSPTAQVDGFPAGSHVLSLEQHGDVVPQLDGEPNPDSVEQTTVTFDAHPDGGVVAHHGYDVYVQGAGLADASNDPSVTEAVQSLHDHGYLGTGSGAQVTSQQFQITRNPGT